MNAVTVKGQVTIPKSIRDLLDIRPGSLVEFVMDADGRVVLPDFFIGAHAAVRNFALLTRDRARYHVYFPTVRLIFPVA